MICAKIGTSMGVLTWEELVEEIQRIRQSMPPLRADWFANKEREEYGIWVLRLDAVGTEEAVAVFTVFAAHVVEKLGIEPQPLPQPSEHDPQWEQYLQIEEEGARLQGKTLDLADTVPYGLGVIDRDAVDPCTRAWLEELRRHSIGFRLSEGTCSLSGQKSIIFNGEIPDLYEASSIYCMRRARDEIGKRLQNRAGTVDPGNNHGGASTRHAGNRPPVNPNVSVGQSHRKDILNSLRPVPCSNDDSGNNTEAKSGEPASSTSERDTPPHMEARTTERAERARVRQEVVMPILRNKRWSRGRWAREAGVSKNSVYEYLDGKRTLSNENRQAMADVLGLQPKGLPD
jgi:hypothetical protein